MFFDTDGASESTQTIIEPITVIYNAGAVVLLLPNFELETGASRKTKIDGCPDGSE